MPSFNGKHPFSLAQQEGLSGETPRSYYSENRGYVNNLKFSFIIFTRCLAMGNGSSRIADKLIRCPPTNRWGLSVLTRSAEPLVQRTGLRRPAYRNGQT